MGRFFRVSIGYTLLGHHNSPQYRKSSISSVEKPSASQVSTKVVIAIPIGNGSQFIQVGSFGVLWHMSFDRHGHRGLGPEVGRESTEERRGGEAGMVHPTVGINF